MPTKMDEIRKLQQQLFEAQQGKVVSKLTEANVVELVRMLQQRQLVTLHLSGQGYITPRQLANEIKDQLLLAGGRISVAELHAAINTDIDIIEDRVKKMCEENPPSADPRTPGVVLEEGQLVTDYYLDDIAAEVNTELQETGQITLTAIAARYNFSSDFVVEAMRRRIGSMIDGQLQAGATGVIYTTAFVERHHARLRGALSAVTLPGSVTKLRKAMNFQVRASQTSPRRCASPYAPALPLNSRALGRLHAGFAVFKADCWSCQAESTECHLSAKQPRVYTKGARSDPGRAIAKLL